MPSAQMRSLSTLLPFDCGTVRVLGMDPVSDRRRLQPRISLTGQFAAVDDKLSCIENLEMMGELFGLGQRTARIRGMELLDRFDLATSRDVRATALSGGMRRKLDIAVGLISSPELVFLDEPTTGLDTRSRQVLWDEIRTLAREGTSVLLTTQYLEEADALATRSGFCTADASSPEARPTSSSHWSVELPSPSPTKSATLLRMSPPPASSMIWPSGSPRSPTGTLRPRQPSHAPPSMTCSCN